MSEKALPFSAWHEDDWSVLWWTFPVAEPPYVGSPLDSDWPFSEEDYQSLGWTPLDVPDPPVGMPLSVYLNPDQRLTPAETKLGQGLACRHGWTRDTR